jgi:hypothetical protein
MLDCWLYVDLLQKVYADTHLRRYVYPDVPVVKMYFLFVQTEPWIPEFVAKVC